MNFETRNPATGELLEQFDFLTEVQLEQKLTQADKTAQAWASSSFADRAALLKSVAEVLHDQREALAHVISLEMGKRLVEAFGEVDKCASACSYYADNSEAMLQDEI